MRYESVNTPDVMTPWELREHLNFLLRDLSPHPQAAAIHQIVGRFQTQWQALWSEFGTDRSGWPAYRQALNVIDRAIEQIAPDAEIVNGSMFMRVLRTMVLGIALADHPPANADEPQWPPQAATS